MYREVHCTCFCAEDVRPLLGDLVAPMRLECIGVEHNYYRVWWLQTAVVPSITLILAFAISAVVRRWQQKSAAAWSERLSSEGFFVLFIAYPGICRHAFQMVSCRKLGPSHSVVSEDYFAHCEDRIYQFHRLVSVIVLVGFGLCVPLALLLGMLGAFRRCKCEGGAGAGAGTDTEAGAVSEQNPVHDVSEAMRAHLHEAKQADWANRLSEPPTSLRSLEHDQEHRRVTVRFIAEDLRCTEIQAQDAIMDIVDNRKYSFVMAGFRARYFWWETIDMLRKLSILSVAAWFGHGTVRQAYCTAFLVFFWVSVQSSVKPYAFFEDNWLKFACVS